MYSAHQNNVSMEVERAGVVGTSRLYKILFREREREELEQLKSKESAFRNLKRTLSKKFSFKKLKTNTGETFQSKEHHFPVKCFTR